MYKSAFRKYGLQHCRSAVYKNTPACFIRSLQTFYRVFLHFLNPKNVYGQMNRIWDFSTADYITSQSYSGLAVIWSHGSFSIADIRFGNRNSVLRFTGHWFFAYLTWFQLLQKASSNTLLTVSSSTRSWFTVQTK